MKKVYRLILTISLLCLVFHSVEAQHTFEGKKRKMISVNTSSLHARKIPPRPTSFQRISQSIFEHNRKFSVGRNLSPHRVLHSDGRHPAFIKSSRNMNSSRAIPGKDPRTACFAYLEELAPLLQIQNGSEEFSIENIKSDKDNGTHIRLQQHYKGVAVHGAEIMVHLNSYGEGMAFNGKYVTPAEEIDVVPSIDSQTAINKAKIDIFKSGPIRSLTSFEKRLIEFAEPEATLCIYEDRGLVTSLVLAYRVMYSPAIHKRMEYFIDAHTGNILRNSNTICLVDGPKTTSANDLNGVSRTVHTYQVGSGYYMLDASRSMFNATESVLPDEPVGGILTVDMDNTFGDDAAIVHMVTGDNVWNTSNHSKAVSAHFNAGMAYEYFLTNHERNSINGQGGSMISLINVSDPENGNPLDNAFWNGKAMFYGNGIIGFKPLAGGLDVAGHEMTHGVVENTANLEYEGESGAINESMADIFGSMMDPDDWEIGEDVVKVAAFPSGALRSLEDPHNGGTSLGDTGFQPKHVNEKYNGTEDNGGVHINSGIPNHAFYRYAEAITRDKAADVFYKALDEYLTKSSKFIDLRLAVIAAAGDLFGPTSNEVTQAGLAFDAVGITNGQGGDYEENLPENPGNEFLLVYNTFQGDPSTLYRAPVNSAAVNPLTTTEFLCRPSVTDDGSFAVFVAGDKTIHSIITTPGEDPQEFVVQDETIWSKVAISKDGKRMAAVTEAQINTIYVYDFVSEEWGEFTLYNPTYSDGINSGGAEYADALEWDYSGEFVVYDAFNRIQNESGNDIEYWDVNFIHAWDIANNDFGDGRISKLFSSLPEGVSIGNPTFAKLSPHILAFDMVDALNDAYYVLGSNIETGETDIIFTNETLGFPSFNKDDTRVAFTLDEGAGDYYTGFVNLNGNKISSSDADATDLFATSQWPVYFSSGSRDIDDDVTGILTEENTVRLSCYPNPFVSELLLELPPDFAADRVEVMNLLGQRVYTVVRSSSGASLPIKLDNLPGGQYVIHVQNGKKVGACRAVKMK